MKQAQKSHFLRLFMLAKSSLDPRGRCMTPGVGSKRKPKNDAKWVGLFLFDQEMENLVADVMTGHEQGRGREHTAGMSRFYDSEAL